MRIESEQLQAFILDAKLVPKAKLQGAVKTAQKEKKRLRDVLLAQNLLAEDALLRLEAYILGIPFVDLAQENIDPTILKIIPEPIARSHNIVAFRLKGKELEVAMLDPDDLATIDFIRKKSNFKVLPRLTTAESIKHVLRQYSKSLQAEFSDLIEEDAGQMTIVPVAEYEQKTQDLKKVAQELPVIRIVDTLLRHAILQRASDIHIEPEEKEVLVRYRIDGILRDAMVLPKATASGIVARIKVLSDLQLDEHRLPQDGRFKIENDEYKYSLRVSILPVFDGEKVVMRLLPEGAKALTLEALGLRGQALEHIHINLRKPVGMILVTGPTGCGKTTTLYSLMELLNTPQVNISTVEDPIEYRMPRVNQTQVNPKINLTFASGLRSLLRQDPDILMVGEIRDKETADLAINAALTGHLVLSTLHTNSAAGALPRLLEMEAEPFLLSSTLSLIVGQRLVRRLCDEGISWHLSLKEVELLKPYCNIENIVRVLQEQNILAQTGTFEQVEFFKPKPSKDCPDGYKGRIGIYEVLPITESIKSLMVQNATGDEIQKQAEKEGMLTMVEDGFVKAAQGLTSIEEVLRVVSE